MRVERDGLVGSQITEAHFGAWEWIQTDDVVGRVCVRKVHERGAREDVFGLQSGL